MVAIVGKDVWIGQHLHGKAADEEAFGDARNLLPVTVQIAQTVLEAGLGQRGGQLLRTHLVLLTMSGIITGHG